LRGDQIPDAGFREVNQSVELLSRKGRAFGSSLNLDDATRSRHDDIHIRIAIRILGVVEVENGVAVNDADRDCSDVITDWVGRECTALDKSVTGFIQSNPGTGYGGATGAAICLKHIAVQRNLALA
jgi:hypothetical protein